MQHLFIIVNLKTGVSNVDINLMRLVSVSLLLRNKTTLAELIESPSQTNVKKDSMERDLPMNNHYNNDKFPDLGCRIINWQAFIAREMGQSFNHSI